MDGGGEGGLGVLFTRPARERKVLDAGKKVGVVIRFNGGLRHARRRRC